MKRQEAVLDIQVMHRKGMSQRKIAKTLGISRVTVKKYVENPALVFEARPSVQRTSQLDAYAENIRVWLKEDPFYSARWIFDRLAPLGFSGSYEIVKRKVHELKSAQQQIAYMRFETDPGLQAQVDFGEFVVDHANGEFTKYYVFCMILGYSRKLYAEIIEHCDLPSFLDCHIHAFEYFGGVPNEILYDRMKNVYIGKIAGKDKFNDSLVGFAVHYGFKPMVAPAYAAWVKGKVERPYRYIRENFWRGYAFSLLETAQKDLLAWLKAKENRVHGTTQEVVWKRFEREKPFLSELPATHVDTSYRILREVRKDCTVSFEQNQYVLPHHFVRRPVVLRVKDDTMRIFSDDQLLVTYLIPVNKGNLVQKPEFYEALKQDREMAERKYGHSHFHKGRAKHTISPCVPRYEMDVQARSIKVYEECVA
jgi:transposase